MKRRSSWERMRRRDWIRRAVVILINKERRSIEGDLRISKRFPSQKKIRVILAMMTTPQTSSSLDQL